MNHLFLPYKLSKLASDKGFDERCLAWYNPKTEEFNMLGQENDPQGYIHLTFKTKEIIQAPLYQQIIDWFREKHKISIQIVHWGLMKGNDQHYYNLRTQNEDTSSNMYSSYYEALSAAIEETLELL